jgi:very-short-patch-repair endonuclease
MTSVKSSPILKLQAHQLRQNQTEAEKRLWDCLRAHKLAGIHFRRQHVIGNYIVDFCAPSKKLIIELDGYPHQKSRDSDAERTIFLTSRGYKVLRFWNSEVFQSVEKIIEAIEYAITHD